jgi:mannobiose 2-epimerase
MKKMISSILKGILIIIAVFQLSACKSPDSSSYLGVKVPEIETALNDLLSNFYPRIVDTIHGGYWTNFEYDWTLSKDQDKMLVTQARGLWTASRAAEVFPENKIYRMAADHGFAFLTKHMWDEKNGGFFQYYFTDSAVKTDPTFKLIYGNSFALYALSEYAKINKTDSVLNWVKKTFDWLEENAHDPLYLGYFNMVLPGKPIPPVDSSSAGLIRKINWSGADQKDQNTSIHLMEALTAAYQVLPDSLVKARLAEMLMLVRDTMADPKGYLHLYFSRTWKKVSHRDSSKQYIIRHLGRDHISFGHNIETAYLLEDASEKLFGKPDDTTLAVSKKLLDHTLANGFDKNYMGLFDKGFLFSGETGIEIIDSTKTWWAQAEAWHALALFHELYPKETGYSTAFEHMWNYIQKDVIDHQYGGWYNNGLDISPANKTYRKAHAWKSCYHDGRALFQVLSYARKD